MSEITGGAIILNDGTELILEAKHARQVEHGLTNLTNSGCPFIVYNAPGFDRYIFINDISIIDIKNKEENK